MVSEAFDNVKDGNSDKEFLGAGVMKKKDMDMDILLEVETVP